MGKKKGRNPEHYKKYKSENRVHKNKIKRIIKSSGLEEAKQYAKRNGVSGLVE